LSLEVWAGFATRRAAGPAVGALAILTLVALGVRRYLRGRVTPDEVERLRRLHISQAGKLGDGEILDIEGDTIFYSWQVAGVGYTAAQDLTTLRDRVPEDRASIIGPVSVKFLPQNPANSIVLCETWSGIGGPRVQLPK
jgi:hypothetical protein